MCPGGERADAYGERGGVTDRIGMCGPVDELQTGARDPGGELRCLIGRHELVTAAVQHKSGHGDLAEQIRQRIADGAVLQGDGGLGGRRHDEEIGEGVHIVWIAASGYDRGEGSRCD